MTRQNTPPSSALSSAVETPRRRFLCAGALSLAGLGGCSLLPRETVVPMPMLRAAASSQTRSDTLVVMLPGIRDRPSDFVTEGLVADLRQHRPDVDVLLADAHFGYYRDRSVLERLKADVIDPARARGHRHIWLVGISLGGFGALGYGAQHGQDIDGIVVLAPYLGEDRVIRDITRAGGPAAWLASPQAQNATPLERAIWQSLSQRPVDAPPIHLGYGREDRMSPGHRLMARQLPPDRVLHVAGGHDWAPWRALWRQWLARDPLGESLARRAPAAAPVWS